MDVNGVQRGMLWVTYVKCDEDIDSNKNDCSHHHLREEGGRERRYGGREGWREGEMEGGRDGGMEGGRDGGRDGGREGWRDGGREGWREGEMEGGRERWREGEMEGGREGGRDGGREWCFTSSDLHATAQELSSRRDLKQN